jgi:hypothetical protein
VIDNEVIYISNGHRSYGGAELLSRQMGIGELIKNIAK